MPEFVISPSIIDHCCSKNGIDDFTKTLAVFYMENSIKIVFDEDDVLINEYYRRFKDNMQFRAWFDILLGTSHRNISKYRLDNDSILDIFLLNLAVMIMGEEKNLCVYDLNEMSSNFDRCRALGIVLSDNEGLKEKIKQLTSGQIIINQTNYGEGGSNIYNEGK